MTVDDYDIGITPVATPFTYYGQRQIRLVKDGYETLTLLQPIPPPWYEYYGLDFISENFVPGKIRDQRVFEYHLQPQVLAPPDQLRARAEALRRGTQATSLPPSMPGGPSVARQSAARRGAAGGGADPRALARRPAHRRPDGVSGSALGLGSWVFIPSPKT